MFEYSDYLRDQAIKYRELAEKDKDFLATKEFLELADICEKSPINLRIRFTCPRERRPTHRKRRAAPAAWWYSQQCAVQCFIAKRSIRDGSHTP